MEQQSFLIGKKLGKQIIIFPFTNYRFLVSAGHCFTNFDETKFLNPWDEYLELFPDSQVTLRINGQFEENIEIKRAYPHPLYHYPGLYNDIAVVELGRRIEYDFKKFGDSPVCIDNGDKDLAGKTATFEVKCNLFSLDQLIQFRDTVLTFMEEMAI